MKKQILFALMGMVVMASCNNSPKTTDASGDEAFQKLSEDFLKGYLAWRPQSSVALGLHEFDGKVTDYSKASIDSEVSRLKNYDKMLLAIDTTKLSTKNYYD